MVGLEPVRAVSRDFWEKFEKSATFPFVFPVFSSQNLEKNKFFLQNSDFQAFSVFFQISFRFFSEIHWYLQGMVGLEPVRAVSRDFWEEFEDVLLFLLFSFFLAKICQNKLKKENPKFRKFSEKKIRTFSENFRFFFRF